jgi:signal transduction histidine kinase
MFDRDRLFRVLYYLSIEENPFLIAQDGYETLRSCINQIKDVDLAISEMEERNELIDKEIIADPEGKEVNTFQHERNQITTCLEKLFEVRQSIELWSSFLTPLLNEAQEFWFCCPVDHTRCVGENKSPMDKWRHFKDHNISPEILSRIQEFQHHCGVLIRQHFQDLLTILDEEIQQEQAGLRLLTNRHARFLNSLPLGLVPEFDRINQSFIGAARFPVTHYHQVDPHFATLLGFSIARIFTFPLLSFGVNTRETDAIAKQLASVSKSKPTVAILFYRTVTRQVVGVHWEIVSGTLDDTHYARGVDITQEIEASRLKQTVSIQKMLRQWLHSIRNASFEQQARVILEEVQELEKKLETNEFNAEFESIYECVKLLMHTARTSVGLIDQALETRGLTQHMCVSDFVSNITSFPHHFAQSEGIPAIYTRYRFLLNGNPAAPQDYSSFFVTGDIISLQSIVDNIISNAVR